MINVLFYRYPKIPNLSFLLFVRDHHSICRNQSFDLVVDTTVVKFGAEAFQDPYGYLGLDETLFRVNAHKSFMTTPGATGPWFKPGIRDTVIASSAVDKIWFQEKAAYEKYLVWRYFGSSNGVFRITPGTIIAKSFDPTKRPW